MELEVTSYRACGQKPKSKCGQEPREVPYTSLLCRVGEQNGINAGGWEDVEQHSDYLSYRSHPGQICGLRFWGGKISSWIGKERTLIFPSEIGSKPPSDEGPKQGSHSVTCKQETCVQKVLEGKNRMYSLIRQPDPC